MKPTPAQIRKVLRYDPKTGLLWWCERKGGRPHNRPAGSKDSEGYVRITHKGKQYRAARVAWVLMKGRWPKKEVDHRNTVKDDNRWTNLRLATTGQNKQNRAGFKNTKSGLKGASHQAGRWMATIRLGGKQIYLGLFDTPEESAACYAKAAKKYFGEFARTS